jgi:hypothetical protein
MLSLLSFARAKESSPAFALLLGIYDKEKHGRIDSTIPSVVHLTSRSGAGTVILWSIVEEPLVLIRSFL